VTLAYLELINRITEPLPPMPVARLGPPPFTPLAKPLAHASVMICSSAGVHRRDEAPFVPINDLSVRLLDAGLAPAQLRPSHPSPIRRPGLIDVNVVHPYQRLAELAAAGLIASATSRHLSILGAIKTLVPMVEQMAPAMAAAAREDGADLLLLVPLCPACHQAVGILARAIERSGIPTVVLCSALDIIELVRPPRTVFLDYPLGNCAGAPKDAEGQRRILAATLEAAAGMSLPGAVVELDEAWPEPGWEKAVVEQYEREAATVAAQRAHEFDAEGRHVAAEQAELVAAMV